MTTILLTNDDGIDAPGIEHLFHATEGLGERIVVAPHEEQSATGHAVTTRRSISIEQRREGWYAIGGLPADCTRIGVVHFAPQTAWVLSGINQGGNIGADVYISGTVAAAREATFLGFRAMAISQYVKPDLPVDWERAQRLAARLVRELMDRPLAPRAFWNVNLPHLPKDAPDPDVVFCKLDHQKLDVRFRVEGDLAKGAAIAHYKGNYHGRQREEGRDVDVCMGGRIAVSEIPLDITR